MTLQAEPQRHHRLSTCHHHPSLEPLAGLCATCLRERLAGIDPDTHQETPVTHLDAELRRSKSYSSSSNANASSSSAASTATTVTTSESRRKSCDVVGSHRTLSDLFHSEDGSKNHKGNPRGLELGIRLKEGEKSVEEFKVPALNVSDMEAQVEFFDEDGEFRTVKEFIELELEKKNGGKDLRSLWETASVSFSNSLVRWQRKEHKKKKKEGSVDMERPSASKLRDTQSERLGRRSCDTDSRLSVDVRRWSVDDTQYSSDEPRASCDGCLIGKTHPRPAPLVSVMEDVKVPSSGAEPENANEIVGLNNKGECSPGGEAQTRDYYSSSERRRRSFDRSGSNKRVESGDSELKNVMNSTVSPETLLVTEKELRDSNWYSLDQDHGAESISSLSKEADSVTAEADRKGFKFKRFQNWCNSWNTWGLMQRRNEIKLGDEEGSPGVDVADLPVPASGHQLREMINGEADEGVGQKLIRSCTMDCGASAIEIDENDVKKTEELMLQRNQSVRFSPNNLDNGLLNFYLTPSMTCRRSTSGKASRLKNSISKGRNSL